MSGGPSFVSGLRFSISGDYTDLLVCSLLYEVASQINDVDVRRGLHGALAQESPSGRLPVTVENYQEGTGEGYILTSQSLQVSIPLSTYYADSVPDLVDSTICLALTNWCSYIRDQKIRSFVEYEAHAGLQTVAQRLSQNTVLKS